MDDREVENGVIAGAHPTAERGKRAEQVGGAALRQSHGRAVASQPLLCVDKHLRVQIDGVHAGGAEAVDDQLRAVTGARVVEAALTAAPVTVDLGGKVVSTWAYNGSVPGPGTPCQGGGGAPGHPLQRSAGGHHGALAWVWRCATTWMVCPT